MKYTVKQEEELMAAIWDPEVAEDLEKFVKFIFPWGKPGTPLEYHKGPRAWQLEELREMTAHLKTQRGVLRSGGLPEMWKKATASGRGPGKSALVAWLVVWMMSTRIGSTSIITANTEPQLKTRTFAEIGKWVTLAINAHWFECTVLSVKPAPWFQKALEDQMQIDTGYYYAQGQLWSEENPDAFAGVHNPNGVLVIYDEASGIPSSIFNVTEGFFTEPVLNRFWAIFSNPRRNSGAFFDCFHQSRQFWRTRQIDSRSVEGIDTGHFERMIGQHGIDSDVVRVEILGMFPNQGFRQFISNDLVLAAQSREILSDPNAPLIMGVDPARFGDCFTVIAFRHGRDARSIPSIRFKNRDNMYVCNEIAALIQKINPDAVNIDAGNGTGIIDRLREMGYKVNEVWFGGVADSKEWANKRTEMYARLRDWLGGGSISTDPKLFMDLTAPEYNYFGKAQDAIMLESKESMTERIGSPDDGDALALTFAVNVSRRDTRTSRRSTGNHRMAKDVDYQLFGYGR